MLVRASLKQVTFLCIYQHSVKHESHFDASDCILVNTSPTSMRVILCRRHPNHFQSIIISLTPTLRNRPNYRPVVRLGNIVRVVRHRRIFHFCFHLVRFRTGTSTIRRGFSFFLYLQENPRPLTHVSLRPLSVTSLTIHYWLIIFLSLGSLWLVMFIYRYCVCYTNWVISYLNRV
jgi:hypothetical protein